jgi:hypothetical protein
MAREVLKPPVLSALVGFVPTVRALRSRAALARNADHSPCDLCRGWRNFPGGAGWRGGGASIDSALAPRPSPSPQLSSACASGIFAALVTAPSHQRYPGGTPDLDGRPRGRPNSGLTSWFHLAPRDGFEPSTQRLTAACSTTELPGIRAGPEGRGSRPVGGRKRNRTAVHGFAVRCIATLPSGRGQG